MGNHIENKPCPICSKSGKGSSLSVYDDGEFCNECGYTTRPDSQKFYRGDIRDIQSRSLSKEALAKYKVEVFKYNGYMNKDTKLDNENCVAFNFYKDGKLVKQKIRSLVNKKNMTQIGDGKQKLLFGQGAFNPNKRIPIIITEGEFDAVAAYQMMQYPAVSIGGASGAVKHLQENIEWLSGFSHIVLCFDNDEAGQKAIDSAIGLFEPGTVRIAHLSEKDANDMLKANKTEEFKRCIWNAEIRRPSTILTISDVLKQIKQKPKPGLQWPYQEMNKVTYGLMPGDMYTLAAAEGVGKTEFIKELIFNFVNNDTNVGLFSFEQDPASTVQRFVGGELNRKLHLSMNENDWWDEKEIERIAMKWDNKLFLYNNLGSLPLDVILLNIRYLAKAHDVKFIVLDNLTAMCATPIIDGKVVRDIDYITHVAGKIDSLCKELKISVLIVAHLNNDTINKSLYLSTKKNKEDEEETDINDLTNKPGMTWESGRVPASNHIFGGGMLRKLSAYVIVLSRNSISEDKEIARTTKVKFLKTRLDSTHTGLSFDLKYNFDTGRLEEEYNSEYKENTTRTIDLI